MMKPNVTFSILMYSCEQAGVSVSYSHFEIDLIYQTCSNIEQFGVVWVFHVVLSVQQVNREIEVVFFFLLTS